MRQASKRVPDSAEKTVRDSQSHTPASFREEKIRIVLEGLRGEDSIAELSRKEGINQSPCWESTRADYAENLLRRSAGGRQGHGESFPAARTEG
jgi:transposase